MKKLLNSRTIISIICIVIGLAPVLTFINTMESGKALLDRNFGKNSSTLVEVQLNNSTVSYEVFEKLSNEMEEIQAVMPIAESTAQIASYKEAKQITLKAVDSSYYKYAGLEMLKGSFITKNHIENKLNAVIVDELTADELFGTTEILGRTIEITMYGVKQEAAVIGVCKRFDSTESKIDKSQGFAYIPISMLDDNVTQYDLQRILLVVEKLHLEEVQAKVSRFLKESGVTIDKSDIKAVRQIALLDSFIDNYSALLLLMGILWFAVTMVALINIYLLEVEQNKNFYGLLKFYGNPKRKIRHYLYNKAFETAIVCSIFSTLIGLLGSFSICWIINIPVFVSIHSLTLGAIIPIAICMLAVVYPAYKAADTDMNNTIWGMN